MRVDWEIAKRGWRRYAAYPGATVAGVFTNTIFGFIQAYILLAVYRHRGVVGGYDPTDSVTYAWLVQALLMTVQIFGWQELALRVREGSIATDLSRPIDPQRYWLAYDLGRAPYHLLFRGVVPFAIGAVLFRVHYPSRAGALLFVVSVVLAVVVSFALRFLYNLPAFWLLDIRGVVLLVVSVNLFFSGAIVPVAYFPGWLKTVADALPFAAILQTPVDVWLGKAHVWLIGLQVVWAAVLFALGRLVLARATRKLVVQGG